MHICHHHIATNSTSPHVQWVFQELYGTLAMLSIADGVMTMLLSMCAYIQ